MHNAPLRTTRREWRRRVAFKAAKGFAVVDSLAPLSRNDHLWLRVIDTALRFIITRCRANRFENFEAHV